MLQNIPEGERMTNGERIIEFLKENPLKRFTCKEIAKGLINKNEAFYRDKRANSTQSFETLEDFSSQVAAEVSANKKRMLKKEKHLFVDSSSTPMIFWYDPENTRRAKQLMERKKHGYLSEHDLYPLLTMYLHNDWGLYCKRIDERRSRNSRGSGGNHWLYPDVVAMSPIDKDWDDLVKNCVKQGTGQRVKLWSFEVKKELTSGNVRKYFFQAVSNSSWANEGYLVATSLSSDAVEQELRMLSALHGIGVIMLNPQVPEDSVVLLPAKTRHNTDWESVNRILEENSDFKDFIELVSTYYQTGRVRPRDWDKGAALPSPLDKKKESAFKVWETRRQNIPERDERSANEI